MSPLNLIQNVLVGEGVSVTNISYTGSTNAIGRFNGANTSLGFDDGLIITTGTIHDNSDGPHGPNDKPNAGLDNGSSGFGMLNNIVNQPTYNAAILEFDFIPQSDTVRFDYIFASEEYPEWVGGQFNDVFAFFISGPGIPGGVQNMAIIPGTNQAVTINNVNNGANNTGPCNNCSYYVNNGTGNNPPFNQSPFYIQYDGFTKPMQAMSPVQCGETYHLTIAIADVGDALFDSGIFLAANSFSSLQNVNAEYELSGNPFGDNKTMSQECSSAQVKVTRTGDLSEPFSVPVVKSGEAVDGIDYTGVPDVINFNANQSVYYFDFHILNNPNLTEQAEVILDFMFLDPCDNEISKTLEFIIQPIFDLEVEIEFEPIVCAGQDVSLTTNTFGGGGNYFYQWSTGETTPSIIVNPMLTETYIVAVTDTCLNTTIVDSVEVEVPIYDELILGITGNIVETCPYVSNLLLVEALGGAGNYNYNWSDNFGNTYGSYPDIAVEPNRTTTYTVEVTDLCSETTSASTTITVLSPPLELSIPSNNTICPFDSVEIEVNATGGYGNYYYYWHHDGVTDSITTVAPKETTTYTVEVSDDCQTFMREASTTINVQKPDAHFQAITNPKFTGLPITFQNLTTNGLHYSWDFGDGNHSTMTHPNNVFYEPGQYFIEMIAEDEIGCKDTTNNIIKIVEEVYVYVPNAFTPNGDRHNNYFEVSTVNIVAFDIVIFNRWGELLFESKDAAFKWDGTYQGVMVPDGIYPWKIEYKTVNGDVEQISGSVTLLK